MRFIIAVITAALLIGISPVQAKPKNYNTATDAMTPQERMDYYSGGGQSAPQAVQRRNRRTDVTYEGSVVGGRPAECNIRIRGRLIPYCGCAVSLKTFGRVIPELMLASNWRKFPRASPAPGMVAYRSGHVFYIMSVVDSRTVVAYDPNSGGGLTRLHTVSLSRYRVVNPNGNRMAMNLRN
jgi:hypothetical protein